MGPIEAPRLRMGTSCRLAGIHVERPDAEVALEHDRAAVLRDVRPQHAAGPELRHLFSADRDSGFTQMFSAPLLSDM